MFTSIMIGCATSGTVAYMFIQTWEEVKYTVYSKTEIQICIVKQLKLSCSDKANNFIDTAVGFCINHNDLN